MVLLPSLDTGDLVLLPSLDTGDLVLLPSRDTGDLSSPLSYRTPIWQFSSVRESWEMRLEQCSTTRFSCCWIQCACVKRLRWTQNTNSPRIQKGPTAVRLALIKDKEPEVKGSFWEGIQECEVGNRKHSSRWQGFLGGGGRAVAGVLEERKESRKLRGTSPGSSASCLHIQAGC